MRRTHGTTSKKGSTSSIGSEKEAEFNFGYFYRTVEEHVNTYATQAGNPYSVTDIALRVGRLLEAKALREELGSTELVPQVREDLPGTGRGKRIQYGQHDGLAAAALHVRPQHHRALSAESRDKMSKAQRKRWRELWAKRTKNQTTPWSDDADAIIINEAKERKPAPELARTLMPRLKGRSEGAIRQRIARLVISGKLKQYNSKKGEGAVPHLLVEAA